ncbi:MAG: hypothetical protein IT438_03880 [Phycisphaerales bacterium]|nr:hypothetical protein [Phycisphaerales bacterium]
MMRATHPLSNNALVIASVMGLLLALWPVGCGRTTAGADPVTARVPAETSDNSESMDRYYLATCATCGAALGSRGESIEALHHGRQLRFCSTTCRDLFESDPGRIVSRIDAVIIADQLPHYPLDVSIVTGRPLGARPRDFVWGNRLFRASDLQEQDLILADPARYKAKLDRAVIAAQRPGYPLADKCPVQGDILSGDTPIDLVVANRMIRVCCGRCATTVRTRPYQYLAMVDYANRERDPGDAAKPRSSPR